MPTSASQPLPRPTTAAPRWLLLTAALAGLLLAWLGRSDQHWIAEALFLGSLGALCWLAFSEWRSLHRNAQAYALAMQAAHDGFWEWDPRSKKLQVGARLLEILGYREDFLPDTHAWLEIVHPDDRAHYNRAVADHLKGRSEHFYCEYRVRASDGSFRWIGSRGIAVRDPQGRAYQMVGSVSDITERRRYQDNLEFLAHHDSLTGLPNRLELARTLPPQIVAANAGNTLLALFFIDLDRFKDINDTLGHRAGDLLLQGVAQRLGQLFGNQCQLFRQGGDEFIALLPGCPDIAAALSFGEALREAIARPFAGHDADFFTGASIGLSLCPLDAADGETLLRNADTAMYTAKAAGGNALRQYQPEMNQRLRQRMELESALRQAIQHNELELHFQPKIELAGDRLCGAEALLRWRHAGRLIPPDQFIPVAEDSGLILEIGDWVTARCLEHARDWQQRGASPLPLAINLSPRQFWRRRPAQEILARLATSGLPPSVLEVEVTESLLLNADSGATEELEALRRAGIRVALDDFGTGYSSLSYLQRLPIGVLKIDKSFIRALDTADQGENRRAGELVRAIIAMAHSLSLSVVAEGVETPVQLAELRDLGCDIVQGYFYSRPLPAEEFFQRYLAPGKTC
ncbi:EAL domain-containing protein [Dechloromonas sp. ZY10]|uniref:putative bifunctional diguanylate cyclase/phosphodiesterase n=1 Tax=Dechloromonas aquae TaxID=2664436 RepID=UPI0035277129